MNKKTMYMIVAVIVIIIIIVGVAAALLINNGGGTPSTSPTPTPTPTPAVTTVAGATTLTFNVNESSSSGSISYVYSMKTLNWTGSTADFSKAVIRLDLQGGYSYIMDAAQQKSWDSTDGGANWTGGTLAAFTADWPVWSPYFSDYLVRLGQWNGAGTTLSYTATGGASNVIYNICPNATIADSVFSPD